MRPRLALAGQANTRAGINTRRNIDLQQLRLVAAPFSAAIAARGCDDFAASVAIGAWPLDHEKALFGTNLANAAAHIASTLAGAGRCAAAIASVA